MQDLTIFFNWNNRRKKMYTHWWLFARNGHPLIVLFNIFSSTRKFVTRFFRGHEMLGYLKLCYVQSAAGQPPRPIKNISSWQIVQHVFTANSSELREKIDAPLTGFIWWSFSGLMAHMSGGFFKSRSRFSIGIKQGCKCANTASTLQLIVTLFQDMPPW